MENYFFRSYKRLIILIWTIIVFLVWVQFQNRHPLLPALLLTACIFTPTIPITNFLSNRLLPKAMYTKKMNVFVGWFLGLSIILSFIYALFDQGFMLLQENGFFTSSPSVDTDSLLLQFMSAVPTSLLVNLGFCGLRFYYEHTTLQETHLRSQLQILQEQINPHFMFNVLNHIHILMQKDVELASALLVKYSDILRYQLYNGKKESVSLNQEVQFLKDVIEVEKMRWGDALKVHCTWKIKDGEKEIQPLLFITFIENAFKHVSRSLSEKGYINVFAEQKRNSFYLEVENSKSTRQLQKKNASASGLGLKNIKERLEILYPGNHKLHIRETALSYTIQLNITL
ncbi:sensor histidine kinase [Sinomicrobium sp. M5D2P17]